MACSMANDLDGRLPPAGEGGAEAVNGVPVGRATAVGGVDHHGDAGLVGQAPEAVEHRVEGIPPSERGGRGRRAHDHGAGTVVEGPGQLLGGPGRIGQGEVGSGEDAAPVVEGPVLDHPPVEGPEEVADRLGIVGQRLLVDHPEGGEEQASGHALLVEGGQAGLGLAVGGADRFAAGQELHRVPSVGVAPEVVVHGPGQGHRVEGRIGHGPADPAADDVVATAVDLGPLDDPGPEGRIEVPGEGVECLVVVVVGVEDRMAELPEVTHLLPPRRRPRRGAPPSYRGPGRPGPRAGGRRASAGRSGQYISGVVLSASGDEVYASTSHCDPWLGAQKGPGGRRVTVGGGVGPEDHRTAVAPETRTRRGGRCPRSP